MSHSIAPMPHSASIRIRAIAVTRIPPQARLASSFVCNAPPDIPIWLSTWRPTGHPHVHSSSVLARWRGRDSRWANHAVAAIPIRGRGRGGLTDGINRDRLRLLVRAWSEELVVLHVLITCLLLLLRPPVVLLPLILLTMTLLLKLLNHCLASSRNLGGATALLTAASAAAAEFTASPVSPSILSLSMMLRSTNSIGTTDRATRDAPRRTMSGTERQYLNQSWFLSPLAAANALPAAEPRQGSS